MSTATETDNLHATEGEHHPGPAKPTKPHHDATVSHTTTTSTSPAATAKTTTTVQYVTVQSNREYEPVFFDLTSPMNITGPDRTFVSSYNAEGRINIETRGILSPSEKATIDALNVPFQQQAKAPIACCVAVTPFLIIPCLWPVVVIAWIGASVMSVALNIEPNKDFQRIRAEHPHQVNTLTCCCAIVNYELMHEQKAPRVDPHQHVQSEQPAASSDAAAPLSTDQVELVSAEPVKEVTV